MSCRRGGGGRGTGRVFAGNFFLGGAKSFFFRGRNFHQGQSARGKRNLHFEGGTVQTEIQVVFYHWEIRGGFRKRVVLANVPSFRFSFRGNMRTYPRSGFRSMEHTLVPIFVPGEHPPKPPFWKTSLSSEPPTSVFTLGMAQSNCSLHLEWCKLRCKEGTHNIALGFAPRGFLRLKVLLLRGWMFSTGAQGEDPPKGGLGVSVCSFSSHEAAVWPSTTVAKNIRVFPLDWDRTLRPTESQNPPATKINSKTLKSSRIP